MHVVATAGHVDHGKSTLVEALTGTHPDRLEQERERGLTIELGYCWTTLPDVGDIAFVDVPGHERFISTMLSGIGPVPAALLVVAADDSWMPQAAEHLAALDALGVSHGVVAVTRSDLTDPAPAVARAAQRLAGTSLAGSPIVPVSAVTGFGLDELRTALGAMVGALPQPDPTSDVRLWADRCFHVHGSGLVVTGTLPAGRITVGDVLEVADRRVRVRGLHSLGRPVSSVTGVARVAVNLSAADRDLVDRHSVLVTPGAWHRATVVDVRLVVSDDETAEPPRRPLLHVGAVAVPTYARPLAPDVVRLALERPLPLRIGDRALLRDPGSRRVWGLVVLDPDPPELRRRGAARARAEALAGHSPGDVDDEVRLRGLVHSDQLRRLGVDAKGGWLLDPGRARELAERLRALVEPHPDGLPVATCAARLDVPADVVRSLVEPPMRLAEGRVTTAEPTSDAVPADVLAAVERLRAELRDGPFAAPAAERMRELGLDARVVALASRAGLLLRVGDGIVLDHDADVRAAEVLATLPQPFTTSEARQALHTSRRVVLPLLAHLDRRGLTRRLPDDRRVSGSGSRR